MSIDYIRRQIAAAKGDDPDGFTAEVRYSKLTKLRMHREDGCAEIIEPPVPEVKYQDTTGGTSATLDLDAILEKRLTDIELLRAAAKLYARSPEAQTMFEQFVDEALS